VLAVAAVRIEDDPASSIAASVRSLHQRVDAEASRLTVIHEPRLRCARGCAACCIDDLTVLEVEAARIRSEYAPLLRAGPPHPVGACAFLDEAGACRIYAARPYVCRTQGLPLRWFEENSAEEIEEYNDICELNRCGPELSRLALDHCWLIGPTEEALVDLQERSLGQLRRVPLRGLFGRI
jgi:Fe-S-cluster containining protein